VERVLAGAVPRPVLELLDVRFGPPGPVIQSIVAQWDAGMIVLGGKYHSALGRWLGGSTAHHLARTAQVPVLVTGPSAADIVRILVAVDLSDAAVPTLAYAQRLAGTLGAELSVLYVVEPVPTPLNPHLPIVSRPDPEQAALRSTDRFERMIQTSVHYPDAKHLIRRGLAAPVVLEEARAWQADLVVVGSHSKGWVDRLVLGSVTQQLLGNLSTSVLVVPGPASPRNGYTPPTASPASMTHGAGLGSSRAPSV
jgi:nucleotide-binding universal stress UspA family protein